MSEQPQNTELHIDENKLIAERKQKLAELRSGIKSTAYVINEQGAQQ